MRTRVKICGITSRKDALAAVECGADALGFVFAPSPRQITADQAGEIIAALPPLVMSVGVFVDAPEHQVREIAQRCRLDVLQFHGDESPAYCHDFDRRVIKAFRVRDESVADQAAGYDVDARLFDASTGGGTGRTFDWDLIREIGGYIILAGGLTPENVIEAIRRVRPYAIDVSSGVEDEPGRKNRRLMEAFIRQVRRADHGG